MPHINKKTENEFLGSNCLEKGELDHLFFDTKGELEYAIAKLCKSFMRTRKYKYTDLHDCVYAVEHCAHEFRRLYLDKREDEAIKANGNAFES